MKKLKLEVKGKKNGKVYNLDVQESDGSARLNNKICAYKNGDKLFMREIADYCSRTLTTEAKALVDSMYKQTGTAPEKNDPAVNLLRKKFGKIAVCSATILRTNGKETGRMYHFTVDGKKKTAVWDYAAKEVCLCAGYAKQGALYLENWITLDGKPAVAVNNRVYSQEYRRKHRGPSF